MAKELKVADHSHPAAYWEGGNYELNLSFDTLRDRQWQRVIETIWEHPYIYGPLTERYTPGGSVPLQAAIQTPPPTATLTQHGQMKIDEAVIGCDILATRSLFECLSVLIPVGMFDSLVGSSDMGSQYAELQALNSVLYDLALRVYDAAPFKIAAIGYERGCQLPAELRSNADLCKTFVEAGNALVHDEVLRTLNLPLDPLEQVRAHLRWLAPQQTIT
jgi:hypothetical protein